MAASNALNNIQKLIANPLDSGAVGATFFAGILGDAPSHYSKSPPLWNAAFHAVGLNAIYLPFDVADAQVGDLLRTLKDSDPFMGVNVTVPHKVRVIDFLDDLDPDAARIQAVNTIVRTPDGKLIGYNTDGEGFIESLLGMAPGVRDGFIASLKDLDVLLLGAGGSARAVAFHLSDHLRNGQLIIANRTREMAQSLVEEICKCGGQAIAIDEAQIAQWAPKVGLIVNSSTKGQGGWRQLPNRLVTLLEPYSALASANPPGIATDDSDFAIRWRTAASADIAANNRSAEALVPSVPQATRFYDLIYHPEETVFLRQGRLSGHRTMNGKNMIVCQAVIAFCKHICARQLAALGKAGAETYQKITEVMQQAW
jgi:shikimate dehydrogenase